MKFSALFSRKGEKTAIGIDIGSSAIKVVQLTKKKGKVTLQTYGALALGPYANLEIGKATNLTTGKITEALVDILREAKVTTKVGGMAIPFSASLMTIIELPAASEKNLKDIMPIEAKKYIPVPIGEVSLDWSVIPEDEVESVGDKEEGKEDKKSDKSKKDGESKEGNSSPTPTLQANKKIKIMIVAIHNDIISKFKEIVKGASLNADLFEIEIFSAARAVVGDGDKSVMIMDVGAASTKLYIIEKGNVESSHTINRGSQDVTATISRSLNISGKEAEILKRTKGLDTGDNKNLHDIVSSSLDYIFSETNKVLRNYGEKNNKVLTKVVLIGGGSSMKGFAESASANLQAEVVAGDPFSKVEAPAFVSGILKNNGPEFAVALGLALRRLSE